MSLLELVGGITKELFNYGANELERGLSTVSVRTIILVNLIPLFGALFLGWSILDILLLYWSESAAIGFYTIIKMIVAQFTYKSKKKKQGFLGKVTETIFFVLFFMVHFGGFMLGHLFFILVIFLPFETRDVSLPDSWIGIDLIKLFAPIWYATLAFFLSHGVSFVKNFILNKEYKKEEAGNLFIKPYPRIVIMQVAIILGMVISVWMIPLGIPPLGPILIIIAAKTLSDIAGHIQEHKNL